jgi:hypothetical protein
MSANTGPNEPSKPTVKRLFAVSGNRCAFPKCPTPLIDPPSGSVVGAICHIKGKRPGAVRYDPNQSNEDRHGFENLVLLCNIHHKIVDDDDIAYTVERLVQMKKNHESRQNSSPAVDDATAERFATVAITNSTVHGSVVTTHGQSGGQAAHVINNYHVVPPSDESVRLEGKMDMGVDFDHIAAFGCVGSRLTVICRSNRPAKIQSAHLYIEGVDVMKGIQKGFGSNFGHTPVEGAVETFVVDLIPISTPSSQEGHILNRDDVCRFFCPLPMPATMLALQAKPEQVSVGVRFFDDTKQTLLTGDDVQNVIKNLYEVHKERPGKLRVPIRFGVQVLSKTRPTADMVGRTNPSFIPIVPPDKDEGKK